MGEKNISVSVKSSGKAEEWMYNLNYTGYNKRNRRKQKTAEESGIKQKKTEAVEERRE